MFIAVKDHLRELVLQALLDLKRSGQLVLELEPDFVIERTKNRDHGDYACNLAMLLGKPTGRKPRAGRGYQGFAAQVTACGKRRESPGRASSISRSTRTAALA